jgi:hypothetical protein
MRIEFGRDRRGGAGFDQVEMVCNTGANPLKRKSRFRGRFAGNARWINELV